MVHTLSVGGLENGVVNLVNHINPKRFKPYILSLCEPDTLKEKVNPETKIVVLNKQKGNDFSVIFRLAKIFRKERPSIVHTHAWGTLVEGLIAAKLAKVPIIIHGEHGTMETRFFNVLTQNVLLRFVDSIVSVSENHGKDFSKKMGVSINRIKSIQNGVDTNRFVPNKTGQLLKKSLGVPENHLVIGSVGRLVEVKQYHLFLRLFYSLLKKVDKISAVLVGDGPLRKNLTEMTETLGIKNRVYFLGQQDDITKSLPLMDIFLLTSKSEGLSNTILEAMACGIPVVATDVGGTNEIVINGETGLLSPPQDFLKLEEALLDLIRNKKKREKFGEQGRKRVVSSFNMTKMVHSYENFYVHLLTKKKCKFKNENILFANNL